MSQRIRIVHLITGMETGGAERMLHKLLSQRDSRRFEHSVVVMTGGGPMADSFHALGLPLYFLAIPRGQADPRGLWRLWRLLRQLQPDILQTWLYHADLLGTIAARLLSVPRLIWSLRCSYMDLSYSRSLRLILWLLARLSRWPDLILVNSKAGQTLHQQLGYRPRAWRLIPNGFDVQQYQPDDTARWRIRTELGIAPDAPVIGMVARFDPMKGFDLCLTAVALVQAVWPNCHLVLVGPGVTADNPFFAEALHRNSLGHRLHLLGRRQDIAALHAAFDIALSASIGEGFANVIGEAMSCGVPCVVTDVGDSAWVVGQQGLVVPAADAKAMAQACLQLLSMDARQRQQLGLAARQRIVDHFSLTSIVKQYQELYEELYQGLCHPCTSC
ncbi:MAG: glycosyltransferase [Magnetococcales bacterium]|nr:glycosyltransferase [Magnetococcales bacterium]